MNSRAVKSSEHFHHSQDSLSLITVNVDHPNSHTKATHLKEQVSDSLASAVDTIVHAKDQVKDHFGASPPQNQDAWQDAWTANESLATTKERISQDRALPATTEIPLARSEIEKDSIDQEAVKEKLEDSFTAIEGMPGPGRYHPHPDRLENVGVTTKVGEKLKTGIISAKEKVFGASVERTETSETAAPILKADIKDSLASAQSSLKTGFRRGKKTGLEKENSADRRWYARPKSSPRRAVLCPNSFFHRPSENRLGHNPKQNFWREDYANRRRDARA
jgi:hypothetical protein